MIVTAHSGDTRPAEKPLVLIVDECHRVASAPDALQQLMRDLVRFGRKSGLALPRSDSPAENR